MEGGSPRKVEKRWTLNDVAAIRRHWRAYGPPVHISNAILSAAWGNKLTGDAPEQPARVIDGVVGPSIAELAGLMQVGAGCDTLEASRRIAERMVR